MCFYLPEKSEFASSLPCFGLHGLLDYGWYLTRYHRYNMKY